MPADLPLTGPPAWPLGIDDDSLALLEQQSPRTPEQRLQQLVQLAWHLRQRDSQRSLALAEEARQLLPLAPDEGEPPSATAAWLAARLQLLHAEHRWLHADLSAAQQGAEAAGPALQAVGDASGLADAYLLLGAVASDESRFDAAQACLRQAELCAERAGDAQRRAVSRGMQAYWSLIGDAAAAERLWGDEMAAQQQHADPLQAMWAWMFCGMVSMRLDRVTEAIPATERASELASEVGQLRHAISTRLNIGVGYLNLNDPATALPWTQQALDLARRTGWPASLGMCLSSMAVLLKAVQRPAEARNAGLEAQRVLQPLADSHTLATVSLFLADLDIEEGRLATGIEACRVLLKRHRGLDQIFTLMAWCSLSRALTLSGEGDQALATLQRALALARQADLPVMQIQVLKLLGELHAKLPMPPQPGVQASSASLHHYEQALAVADGVPGYTVSASFWDGLAQAHAQAGDLEQAYQLAQRAAAARDRAHDHEARQRSMALALGHEVETARAHNERLRERARQAAQRAELLRAQRATLEQLSLIGQEITGQLDIDTVFSRIHTHLQTLLDVSHLSIWLLQPDHHTLSLRFGVEGQQRMAPAQVPLDADFSKVARCLRDNREILHYSPPDTTDPGHMPGTLRTHTALFGPLQVRGRTMGVLSIQSTQVRAYGERERLIFRTLCAYGAIALDNAAAYEQLHLAQQALQRASAGERHARLKAQEATRLKNDFLTRVSRALRVPLALLQGSLQDAEGPASHVSPEARRASLVAALGRSHQVNALARDLLELARLESRAVTPELEPFSLTDLIDDVLQKCADLLSRRRLRVHSMLPADGCDVLADIGMIERVLTELVSQAAHRSPEGGEIRLRVLADDRALRIEVADSGPALAEPTAAERLLRPGRAGTGTGTGDGAEAGAGAGLGLAIAHEMLRLHDLVLSVRCGAGEGLVMSFALKQVDP
jgi:signal transduction histidine kinase